MEKRVLMVVTSNDRLGNSGKTGWHLSEVSHVYYPLKEAGFTIDFASPKGGKAPLDIGSLKLDDSLNKHFVDEFKIKDSIETMNIYEADPKVYQVIYFAGGHGTMWDFPDDEEIQRITKDIYENNGIVSAVCHGPSALVNVKLSDDSYLVDGKEVNSFTNNEERETGKDDVVPFLLESKLRERGAKFLSADNWQKEVVVCDRLITGQNPASAAGVGEAIVDQFNKLGENLRYIGDDSEGFPIWDV